MKNIGLKNFNRNLALLVFFLFVSYGVTSYSSTLTNSTVCVNLDSYCYRYMGMLIAKGGIPYRDAFDNKGPLLYFLNCIGYLINKKYGVFIIEYIFMLAYLTLQYSIARRFVDIKRSVIYTFTALGPIGAFFDGNMTEEYALLFISIGIAVFVDYFVFQKKEFYRIIICGISCGAVLMIRPNMIALWGVFCIYEVCRNIKLHKKFPIKITSLFLAGVVLVVIPFIIWLGVNGALIEFWKDYIITNINYSSECSTLSNIFKSFWGYFVASLSEIYIIFLIILIIKKENIGFNITYIIFMILNLFIVSLSGKGFSHYGLVSLPSLIYPVSSSSITIKNYFKNKAYLFDFFLLATSTLLFWFIIDNYLTTIPALSSGNPQESRNERIVSFIVNNTEPSDRILVLGYKDYYYVESDRLASSKFHFILPMNEDYPGGLLSVAEDINNYPAKIVIVEGYVCPYFDFGNYCLVDEDLDIWMYIDDITSQ